MREEEEEEEDLCWREGEVGQEAGAAGSGEGGHTCREQNLEPRGLA